LPAVPARATIVLDGGAAALLGPFWLAVVANEGANGLDLNGDLDQGDNVLLLVEVAAGPPPVVHNTQLVTSAAGSIPLTGVSDGVSGVLVRAVESANADLNGDGDVTDALLVWFAFAQPTTRVFLQNTGGDHAWVAGGTIGVTANEALTQTDLNGDGDAFDFLFRAYSDLGALLEPGILSASHSRPYSADGSLWAFLRSEVAEARNLNGDADSLDFVLGLWKP
jgi:hypothetical protein